MRRKEDRTSQILELLVKEKKIEVSELSAHLGVSQVTVRKDLDAMEAQGLITREHGFAVLSSTDDIKGRLAYHYEEKKKIALRAAELVKDGDTIMIESGSCCALLAATLEFLGRPLLHRRGRLVRAGRFYQSGPDARPGCSRHGKTGRSGHRSYGI